MVNPSDPDLQLLTRRLVLRPLRSEDFDQFAAARARSDDWLTPWEPSKPKVALDPSRDRIAFATRCGARERDRHRGDGYAFGIFLDSELVGEINISSVSRGVLQSAMVGYWIDEAVAGRGLTPEGLVGVFAFIFDDVGLHRLQINIIPRNLASRRVVEKLGIREEGLALRYVKINGEWEDHINYAITVEEWRERSPILLSEWVGTER
jgi:[ribosomal protein S5]-alanine N-acetyltransferase